MYQGSISGQEAQSYSSGRSPSPQYGTPEYNIPSKQYGLPSRTFGLSRASQKPSLRNQPQAKQGLSQEYGLPAGRVNDIPQNYNAPKVSLKSYSSQNLQQNYGVPKTSPTLYNAPLPTSYGVPDSIITSDYSQDTLSQAYEAPSGRDLSETYGAPSADSSYEPYRVQSKSTDLKTNAVSSSYNIGR